MPQRTEDRDTLNCRRLQAQAHWLPTPLLHSGNTAPKADFQDPDNHIETCLNPYLGYQPEKLLQ
jgi:hypothetical protein